jgi:hypothetical protein
MVLSAETIDAFLQVLQRLRNESNTRLAAVEEHAVDTITNYLAGLRSVRNLVHLCLAFGRHT